MSGYITEFEVYLTDHKNLSANTLEAYKRDLRYFGIFIEEQQLGDYLQISQVDAIAYVSYLKKQGKANSTIQRNVASLRTFYSYLHNKGYISHNPTLDIEAPKAERKMPNVLTLIEVEKLIAKPDLRTSIGKRDKAMIELLYATGIRVSELVSLNLSDINTNMGYIRCKNNGKSRVVPLGSLASKAVEVYIKDGRSKIVTEDEEALFVNYYGKRITRQGFWKVVKRYTEALDIRKSITPHTLRHSFALHLIQNGADIKAVQEMLGHSDVSTTQIYLEMSNSKIRNVYEKTHPRA
ncbi:site-specific tyrosine recombinase XerD [Fusibacter sp. 3D3]|uniref:site-specific tyrosine recombinase XerD n=1 Tax=Fusibacter sp. 3D3 TaxID=1048380 RepID=UPI000853A00A|nr:site-specific tyrosine recombinase XerD [Fusibacter sp. 3D3]GAU76977.1 site-specific recombinase XerD [Fusibacter sp. 3D3]